MPGVHRLQHVQHLVRAHLAQHDAVGAHTQGVAHQVAGADFAGALQVGRARFQAHHMPVLQAQLGGVLDGDDALGLGDPAREHVQHRGLAGAGAAHHDNAGARLHLLAQVVGQLLAHGPIAHQLLGGQRLRAELAHRQAGPVQRHRRDDRIDPAAVGQAGIDHRRAFVDAAANRRQDAADDPQHMIVVDKLRRRLFEPAAALDEHAARAVDDDVVDLGVLDQWLQRAEADQLMQDVLAQLAQLAGVDGQPFAGDQGLGLLRNPLPQARLAPVVNAEVVGLEPRDQRAMQLGLVPQVLGAGALWPRARGGDQFGHARCLRRRSGDPRNPGPAPPAAAPRRGAGAGPAIADCALWRRAAPPETGARRD